MEHQIIKSRVHSCIIGIAFGIIACLFSFILYGDRVLLSGDQSIQLVAAESILAGDGLKVPPTSLPAGVSWTPTVDLREKLVWFPPGYSSLLAFLGWCGLSFPAAALALFYLNKIVSCCLWSLLMARLGIPIWTAACVFLFQSLAYMPATTTDQFLWPIVAGMFLLEPKKLSWAGAFTATFLFCLAIWIRWFGIILPVVWAAWIVLAELPRVPKFKSLVLACVPLFVSIAFYFLLTFYLSGSADPYNLTAAEKTNWILLAKGVYFAATGGISSMAAPVQLGIACMAFLTVLGLVWCAIFKPKSMPAWVMQLAVFQALILVFLVYMQIKKGSAFTESVPAFATARYYFLAQPLSLDFMLFCIGSLNQRALFKTAAKVALLLLLAASALNYFQFNSQNSKDSFAVDSRGFLRPKQFVELESDLNNRMPDWVFFKNNWLEISSTYDSKKILPYDPLISNSTNSVTVQDGGIVSASGKE
jgi:hypothetical protein